MNDFQRSEVDEALKAYRLEMDKIDVFRKEIMVMELTAWNELKYVLDIDKPKYPVNKHFYEVI